MKFGISFENSRILILLPIALIVLSVLHYLAIYHRKKIERWINPALWKTLIPEYSERLFRWKTLCLGFSFVFLISALARPQWGEKDEVINTRGMDIFFLLDLSNSMLAEDASPSRLSRAQTFIKKTTTLLENDRIGIIGFAGSAQLSIPLTTDFQYVTEVVDTLDPGAIPHQGTNIGAAIDAATQALERSGEDEHKNSRALVLITDGEDFGEDALAAAKKIKDFGAGFFALSVGTTNGAPIPVRDEQGVLQTYKKDSHGKPVLSRVNKDLLAKVAEQGGGQMFEIINPDDAAYTLAKNLQRFNRGSQKEQHVITKIERFEWFLVPGLLLLLVFLFLSYKPFAPANLKRLFLFVGFLLLGSLLPVKESSASDTRSLKSYFENKSGLSKDSKKEYEDAARSFNNAQGDDPENPALNFNTGTALAHANKTEEAVSQLQEATRKSLGQGDYATAAKSLFNEGLVHAKNKNLTDAYDRLTKSIDMSKISNQPEVEKMAREQLAQLAVQQKQEQEKNKSEENKPNDSKEKKKDDKKQEGQNGEQKKDDQDKNGENQPKKQSGDGAKDVQKKREFRSGTLSKDTAESIMNDLSDREKQLYHQRLKEKKRNEESNENDW